MNDTLKMYGSIGSEIMNRYFVVAMCFKRQPRWRRLQTINCGDLFLCAYIRKSTCIGGSELFATFVTKYKCA